MYDTVNPYAPGTQPDFYLALAMEIEAGSIVELGSGTGQVTCFLADHGFRMTGVEPSAAMLAIAQRRCAKVEWIHGGATAIGTPGAEMAFMSGHVAQFFLTDAAWDAALIALRRALRPGGRLSFETRDPRARAWEQWALGERTTVVDPMAGPIEWWTELHDVRDGVVSYAIHYRFVDSGEELVSDAQLRFRDEGEVLQSVHDAGFRIEHIYGNWDRSPARPGAPEFIVVASAT